MPETNHSLPDFDDLWDYRNPEETERKFRELLPNAQAGEDASYLAELLTQIARTQGLQQHFEVARQTLDEVEKLLPRSKGRARVRYLLERGRVYNSSKQRDLARPLFLEAKDLAVELGEDFHAVDAAHMLAIVDPPEQQLVWSEWAIERAALSDDPKAQAWVGSLYNNTGWTYHGMGRLDEALATFQNCLAWQKAQGNDRETRIAAWTVARTLRSVGRYEEALEMQLQNLESIHEAGDPDGYVKEELGECLLALGCEDEARPHFARAHEILSTDPWLQRDEPDRLSRLAELGGVRTRE